jgi:Na+-driven multidrug efflux pump
MIGLLRGLDTFASQAYGAGNMYKVGLYFNRARAITFCCMLPLLIIVLFGIKPFLQGAGFDEELVKIAT